MALYVLDWLDWINFLRAIMDKYVLILGVCRKQDGIPLCGNALLWETPNVKGQQCGGMSLCVIAVSIPFRMSLFL